MGFVNVLHEAEQAGVKVEAVNGELVIEAKANLKSWIPKLRLYKTEILAHLSGEPIEPDSDPAPPIAGYTPFPVHTLPGVVGEFATAAAAAIGCDPSFIRSWPLRMFCKKFSAMGPGLVGPLWPRAGTGADQNPG